MNQELQQLHTGLREEYNELLDAVAEAYSRIRVHLRRTLKGSNGGIRDLLQTLEDFWHKYSATEVPNLEHLPALTQRREELIRQLSELLTEVPEQLRIRRKRAEKVCEAILDLNARGLLDDQTAREVIEAEWSDAILGIPDPPTVYEE